MIKNECYLKFYKIIDILSIIWIIKEVFKAKKTSILTLLNIMKMLNQ